LGGIVIRTVKDAVTDAENVDVAGAVPDPGHSFTTP